MAREKILLVEDNESLCQANRRVLESAGYIVYTALTLKQAREWLLQMEPDLILLDVVLPDGDGFDFCAEIQGGTRAYILFLTSRTEHAEKLRGLSLGDDYITKPFRIDELLHRIAAILRRRVKETVPSRLLKRDKLTLDIVARQAHLDGKDLKLSQKEFAVLLCLIQNEGISLSAEKLYEAAWGQPMAGDRNAVQVAVSRLRKKIQPAGYDISSQRGSGYSFRRSLQF